jgi:outer membrane protein TolC
VQAETDLASVRAEVIRDLTAVALAKAELASRLNLPQGGELSVEEGVPPTLPEGDLHQLIALALQHRPEILAQEATVRAQEANLRLARVQNRPSIALNGTLQNQTESLATSNVGWTLSAALAWPLIQGGAVEGGIMIAQAALNSACLTAESLQQQIALQVTRAQLAWEDAKQALVVAEEGQRNAAERARIAQVRFSSGVGLGIEVLDAQTDLASAETQVVNARYELQLAVVALRAALGLTDLPKESL